MSKKTGYLLGILLTTILGTILYYFLCCKPCWDEAAKKEVEAKNMVVDEPEVKETTKNVFSIIDSKSGIAFKADDNFNFKESDFSIIKPVSKGLNQEISKLSRFLKDNPNKSLDIAGYYLDSEKNTTAYPNLGLARSNAVKNYMVSQGISSRSLNTFGALNNDMISDEKNIFYGPIKYGINSVAEGDTSAVDALKALKDDIIANPLIMYFDIGNAKINLSAEQKQKVAKISRYIDKANDNASIQIIGHTDNIGDRTSNIRLGLSRANFAKEYFVKNAISENKINTSSKGPDKPIADNATKEGQAKNRRVVVTIN